MALTCTHKPPETIPLPPEFAPNNSYIINDFTTPKKNRSGKKALNKMFQSSPNWQRRRWRVLLWR